MPVAFLLLTSLLMTGGRWVWLKTYLRNVEKRAEALARIIAPQVGLNEEMGEGFYRGYVAQDDRVVYLVAANYRNGERQGFINSNNLQRGAGDVKTFLSAHGKAATWAHLIKPGQGFPGPYLHVVSVALVPISSTSDVTPLGALKIGYVVPGVLPDLPPFGRGYGHVVIAFWLLTALGVLITLTRGMLRERKETDWKVSHLEAASVGVVTHQQNDLGWLEEEMEKEEKVHVDPSGKSWNVLFNGADLDGWQSQGAWYPTNKEVAGRPWKASLVSVRAPDQDNYIFHARAKKIAGPDGFVILFPCGDKQLAWIIGGWKNTRNEVGGYEATRVPFSVARGRWYSLEVRIEEESLSGYIDGEQNWKLPKTEIVVSSPEVGWQEGLGVAVWNTLGRFSDLRYRSN